MATSGASGTDVKLRVFGPHTNEAFTTICPNDNYLFVVECIVKESFSFSWTVTPLIRDPVVFTLLDKLGHTIIDGVNFILTKENVEMEHGDLVTYVSQVQLHTDLIRKTVVDHGEMEVTCTASSKTASVLLDMEVGGSVEIQDAEVSANVLSFTWSTNMSDVQNFAIVVINGKSGVVINAFAKRNERNYSLRVEFANCYGIALTAFDHCGQHFTTEKVLVINVGTMEKLKPGESVLDGFSAHSCPTSMPAIAIGAENQENRTDAGGTGLRTVFPLTFFAILVAMCC
ncbi:hypothetical protein GBAR_LOCUS5643 [Geodia barretti]|uniref:Uncharacterized protein n=1 Tax=Geodia barretti TaxID=519541 RepID=A0AA35RD71_GEOBA|nr:hypothetical protein GBAR_LOCUS5643 [Geodia barretti]